MSFDTTENLGRKEASIIRGLGESGNSSELAVADHLNAVASNGKSQAKRGCLADEAEVMGESALTAAKQLDGRCTALDALEAAHGIASVLKCGKFSPCDAIDEIVKLLQKADIEIDETRLR